MTVAAVVLAAGAGSRFSGEEHKLLTRIEGEALVLRTVRAALEAGLDETIVVTGAVDLAEVLPEGVRVVFNERWAEGQATSVQMGIEAARRAGHDAVVVGLGDQPGITSHAWAAVGACDSPIAVGTYDGVRRNPVRLARQVWPLLPVDGDEGARQLLRSHRDLVVEVPCDGVPDDIDTLEDLRAWVEDPGVEVEDPGVEVEDPGYG